VTLIVRRPSPSGNRQRDESARTDHAPGLEGGPVGPRVGEAAEDAQGKNGIDRGVGDRKPNCVGDDPVRRTGRSRAAPLDLREHDRLRIEENDPPSGAPGAEVLELAHLETRSAAHGDHRGYRPELFGERSEEPSLEPPTRR
jgi:hypothetical protein